MTTSCAICSGQKTVSVWDHVQRQQSQPFTRAYEQPGVLWTVAEVGRKEWGQQRSKRYGYLSRCSNPARSEWDDQKTSVRVVMLASWEVVVLRRRWEKTVAEPRLNENRLDVYPISMKPGAFLANE